MPDRLLPILPTSDAQAGVPPFQRIAIVGLGLIGGSIALACRKRWPSSLVIAVDRKDVLEQAMVRHAVDVAADDLVVAAGADLVVLVTPVREIVRVLGELPAHVSTDAVVTDTGSTKREVACAAADLPPRLTFVGGHPMGGAAVSGFEHAREDLFAGRPWIFTPTAPASSEAVERLSEWARGLGGRPLTMTADEHDRLLAAISHLPQVVASALMAVVGERAGETGLALAGGGLRDTTRLASSPASVWGDVLASNADEVAPALDALIAELQRLRGSLTDAGSVDRLFRRAAAWRQKLTSNS